MKSGLQGNDYMKLTKRIRDHYTQNYGFSSVYNDASPLGRFLMDVAVGSFIILTLILPLLTIFNK